MRRFTPNLMIAAAALAAVAGSASAQILKAEIPFTFRVGSVVLAPGSYDVKAPRSGNPHYMVLQNRETHAVAAAFYTESDVSKTWLARGTPAMRFACAAGPCTLREVWQGSERPSLKFIAPKSGDGELRIAEIRLTRVTGD
jgi:hypothetical protein